MQWLEMRGLAAFAYFRLKEAGLLQILGPALESGLRGAYYRAVADAELHRAELADVLAVLTSAHVRAVLFKGAILAHLVYPDAATRPMGDLDLWVPAESIGKAQAALERAGYRQQCKETRPPEFQAQAGGEVQMVGNGPGSGLVELHYSVFAGEWVRQTTAIEGDGIACRAVPVIVNGCPTLALSPEDAILQLAVHVAVNHQMGYMGLRSLLDVVLQARSQAPDWAILARRALEWRIAAATWLVLDLADHLLGLPGAADATARLRPGRMRLWLLQRFSNTESVLTGRDITRGPGRFVYQLLLVDQNRDAVRLLFRTLWPEEQWLSLRYGRQGAAVRLCHFAAALRGRL